MSWASTSSRKLSAPRPPVRSSARAAVSKSAHDRVQVPVGVPAARAAAQRRPLQPLRPGGAVPQCPQGLLGGAAAGQEFAGLAQEQRRAAARRGRTPDRGRPGARARRVLGRAVRRTAAGHGPAGRAFLVAQGPAQPPQVGGVHAAQGRGEQLQGGLGVEPGGGRLTGGVGTGICIGGGIGIAGGLGRGSGVATGGGLDDRGGTRAGVQRRPGGGPQRAQERGDGGFVAQRQVVAVDLEGHARGGEGAAYGGDGAPAGAYEDGHLPPGHAVLQVGAAQDVGDVVEFGARRRIGVRLDAAAFPYGRRFAVGAHLLRREPGEGHPAGQLPGGRQHGGARRGARCAGPRRAPGSRRPAGRSGGIRGCR